MLIMSSARRYEIMKRLFRSSGRTDCCKKESAMQMLVFQVGRYFTQIQLAVSSVN